MSYLNLWFDGRHSRRQLPQECVCDCSGSGDRAADVAAWVRHLNFDGPAWLIRQHLKEYGAWSPADLCDHQANLKRLLWLWACNCHESPGEYDYLYLGV